MKKSIILFLALFLVQQTFAYGPIGHEIVGAIADKLLAGTPAAAKVSALLDGMTLERAATIADDIKGWDRNGADDMRAYPHFPKARRIEQQLRDFWRANRPTDDLNSPAPSHHWFHYTDVPVLNPEKYADGKTGRSQWDIVHMMRYCTEVLRGEIPAVNPRKITKPIAVILLAHYLGDIHQPLHVGAEYFDRSGQKADPDRGHFALGDQGGGSILLKLPAGNISSHRTMKLHAYWDNDSVMALFPPAPAGTTKKDRLALIDSPEKDLVDTLAATEPTNWRPPANVNVDDYGEAWANEILPIAREAHERLRFRNVHVKPDGTNSLAEGAAAEQPASDHVSYRNWAARVVRNELQEAGWQLADLLQKTLSGAVATTAASTSASASLTNMETGGAQPSPIAPSPAPSPSATASVTPKKPTPPPHLPRDPIYGPYPVKYKDIIMDWLYMHLQDPLSAKVEWQTEPKRADLPGARGRKLYGYLVLFTVNSRNRFGTYTGKQTHGALIRDGVVIKTTGFGY